MADCRVARRALLVGAGGLLAGCGQMPLLDPRGPVGHAERDLIVIAFVLMSIVVVPVYVLTWRFARRYRASHPSGPYRPEWSSSRRLDLVIWLVPVAIVSALGYLAWTRTHQLDPYKPIEAGSPPIRVEAVSMDWNWLFIYPDQDIAAVNQLVFPAGVPLSLRLTSDSVMTSFFIPALGSQIYAMAGMETRLHLLADRPGKYVGHNQQYSGAGYSDMFFDATATTPEAFAAWVRHARESPETLDWARYRKLAAPSLGHPVTYFSSVSPHLFDRVTGSFHRARDPQPRRRGASPPAARQE